MRNLKNKKGFTLVEVIVVLVILAILAAILIPSLTGYIAEANKKAVVAEARSVLIAAQTAVSLTFAEDASGLAKEVVDSVTPPAAKVFQIDLKGAAPAISATSTVTARIQSYTQKYSEMTFADTAPEAHICIQNVNGAYKVTELWYYDGAYTAYICTGIATVPSVMKLTEGGSALTADYINVWKIADGDKVSDLGKDISKFDL